MIGCRAEVCAAKRENGQHGECELEHDCNGVILGNYAEERKKDG